MPSKKSSKKQIETPSLTGTQIQPTPEAVSSGELTLFQELTKWAKELKYSNKKEVDSNVVLNKIDFLAANKFNVDINTGKENILFEAMTKKQADCLSSMFEAFKLKVEQENTKSQRDNNSNGFEAIAVEWPKDNVPETKVQEQEEDCGCQKNDGVIQLIGINDEVPAPPTEEKPKKKRTSKKQKP